MKARLNFEDCSETSRYSELRTMSTKEHEKRHRSRRSRSPRPSVFSRIRHDRSRSSRQNLREKEGGVFKRKQRQQRRALEINIKKKRNQVGRRMTFSTMDSYDDLKKAFLENYLKQKKCIKDPIKLHNIKQRDEESIEDFVRRYKLESRDVKRAPEYMRIFEFMHGITNLELIKRLYDKISKTVDEMMRVTPSFLGGEVAALNHERKKSFPPWKHQLGNQKQNFKKGGLRNQQRLERKQDQFTLLKKTPKEIFALKKGNSKLRRQ
uniref:Reverse transcriptase domain-containing protein n=1 Tax=Tanacetum cinerariifolium TaxID=118510 RepID=A0A6L2J849_TANCI|nr:reverse transcriptase domain-containing protein [Tanacetum cinerariifolium]